MRISSGSSRPYEHAPRWENFSSGELYVVDARLVRSNGATGRSLPAPIPFSPFSSSARSLKFRGTWATAIADMLVGLPFYLLAICRRALGRRVPGKRQGQLFVGQKAVAAELGRAGTRFAGSGSPLHETQMAGFRDPILRPTLRKAVKAVLPAKFSLVIHKEMEAGGALASIDSSPVRASQDAAPRAA